MPVALTGPDTKYLMYMLEGTCRGPVFPETEDEPIRSQITKWVAYELAGHPGPSKLPKHSEEVKCITPWASLLRPFLALEG